MGPGAATDEGDALGVTEPADALEEEALVDADVPLDAGDDALSAGERIAGDGDMDVADEGATLNGAEEPARLREEAERLHREAQARQKAAAELREEVSKLREEAARLLEVPQELQAEAARLREEARAAQGVLEADAPDETVEVSARDAVTSEQPAQIEPRIDQPTTEIKGGRRRGWRRGRRG